ncbi:hypothetical protein D3C78_1676850 [compost metagenome]
MIIRWSCARFWIAPSVAAETVVDLCRSEPAREEPESATGCQTCRVIVYAHRRNAARSKLAPTGIALDLKNFVEVFYV